MIENRVSDFMVGGFWGEIETLKNFPFFETYPAPNLDAITIIKYGDRILSPKMKGLTKPQIAQAIIDLFGDKWEKLILIKAANLDFLSTSEKHLLETSTQEKEQSQTGGTVNKVSAYNDVSLIADSGSDSTNETTETGANDKEVTERIKSYEAAFKNLDTMQKMAIISLITLDVVNTISLTVY